MEGREDSDVRNSPPRHDLEQDDGVEEEDDGLVEENGAEEMEESMDVKRLIGARLDLVPVKEGGSHGEVEAGPHGSKSPVEKIAPENCSVDKMIVFVIPRVLEVDIPPGLHSNVSIPKTKNMIF